MLFQCSDPDVNGGKQYSQWYGRERMSGYASCLRYLWQRKAGPAAPLILLLSLWDSCRVPLPRTAQKQACGRIPAFPDVICSIMMSFPNS